MPQAKHVLSAVGAEAQMTGGVWVAEKGLGFALCAQRFFFCSHNGFFYTGDAVGM